MQRITTHVLRAAAPAPCRLRFLSGSKAGDEVPLPDAGLVLGAGAGAGVLLEDRAVSGRHASVRPVEGGFEVCDLGSRNGTWVDGVGISRAVVPLGTTLRVGATLVQLLPAEEPVFLPPSPATSFGEMLGGSVAMRTVFTALERASGGDAPILLGGESGTGKEVAARAVHAAGVRAAGPFVVFDCGAATETLVEGDLFGHVKGAFTGAHETRPGAFALADRGTLFLDEIGDLPLALQPKLLRLLEAGEVRPLGGDRMVRHDVRVIAATHRDLFEEVRRGTFRGDLYYRLAVVEILLPPLRSRRDDIPDLLRHFVRSHGRDGGSLAGPALERLVDYAWPGNVRELRNVVARASALGTPGSSASDLPWLLRPLVPAGAPRFAADRPYLDAKEALISEFDRGYLTDLLRRHGNNLSQAARAAQIDRKYIYRLLARAGLQRPERE